MTGKLRLGKKYVTKLLVAILFLQCSDSPEFPDYLAFDWFANFTIDDGSPHILKENNDNHFASLIYADTQYSILKNPDGSDRISIYMNSGLEGPSERSDTVIFLDIAISFSDVKFLDLEYEEEDVIVNHLIEYLENRRFVYDTMNHVSDGDATIRVKDEYGTVYSTNVPLPGGVYTSTNYSLRFLEVEPFDHSVLGLGVRATTIISAVMIKDKIDEPYRLEADAKSFFAIPK